MPRPDHPAIRLPFEAAAAEADKSPPPTAAETFAAKASAEPEVAARKQCSLAILRSHRRGPRSRWSRGGGEVAAHGRAARRRRSHRSLSRGGARCARFLDKAYPLP